MSLGGLAVAIGLIIDDTSWSSRHRAATSRHPDPNPYPATGERGDPAACRGWSIQESIVPARGASGQGDPIDLASGEITGRWSARP